ncbi:helix-turn-helix transcriptional regulator [Legionella sp. CNM-1927-20]|uniref:helix-turn-helix transcriptional regulator n=1 Tax=Legionella sp. CNM-1927-20 TaxID=3422221 RepID=UPI00403A8B0F
MDIPYILSLGNKNRINEVCEKLNKCNMEYFVCYIVFNNSQKFVLSNMYHLLKPYYGESFYKEDYSYSDKIITGNDFYICDKTNSVSLSLKRELEERFSIYRGYYTVRRCPECIFIFGAIRNKIINDYEVFYKNTLSNFNEFCLYFVDEFEDLIKFNHPAYENSLILNDKYYRKNVILNRLNNINSLTQREIDILFWAANGKTSSETALILNISQATVNDYRKSSIKKLNCSNITHAVFEAIKLGYLGSFNKIGSVLEIPNLNQTLEKNGFTTTNIHLINA